MTQEITITVRMFILCEHVIYNLNIMRKNMLRLAHGGCVVVVVVVVVVGSGCGCYYDCVTVEIWDHCCVVEARLGLWLWLRSWL